MLQSAEMLPRHMVKSSKQCPQVTTYKDNHSSMKIEHVEFIIWAFYGLVNAVAGLPYVILGYIVYKYLLVPHRRGWLQCELTSFQQSCHLPSTC